MLPGDVSRIWRDRTGRRIPSARKDPGGFIWEVLFELTLKDDEMGRDISVQWHSRRKKQGCENMWPVGGQVGEAQEAWRHMKKPRGRLYLPKMALPYIFYPTCCSYRTLTSSVKRSETLFPPLEPGWTLGTALTKEKWRKPWCAAPKVKS